VSAVQCLAATDRQTEDFALQLASVFDDCFLTSHQTRMVGGAAEPWYRPAEYPGGIAVVHYREDFAASVLHETAHWCLAGERRRRLVDYGYWYVPEGRSPAQQREFERVESRPQALEWCFSQAAGLPFSVSIDNPGRADGAGERARFTASVLLEARRLQRDGLPGRANRFFSALCARYRPGLQLRDLRFNGVQAGC
jgi:elongation factor P hydroxylase